MAAAITMQMLCWISIVLVGHISGLNLNRPTNRWARSDDATDGWQASNGPYNPGPYPISRPVVTEVNPVASTTSTASTALKADEGLHFLTAASPEGFYEVMVGKKSPISGIMGVGGSYASTGSPDVIIGRVVSSVAGIESTTTTSAIGYSHPVELIRSTKTVTEDEKKKIATEKEEKTHTEIKNALEMESRSASTDFLITKNDYTLPPGSFYLPAVSRKDHKYYSDSEKAIYIPLQRKVPQTQSFPVRTRVILVNKNKPVIPVVFSPPPANYQSKDGDEEEEEVEEEEEEEGDEEEEEENKSTDEEDQENEKEQNISDPFHKADTDQSTTPVQSHASALDLVMTLYPSLPKLIPTSYFSTQTIKNLLKLHGRLPNIGGEVGSGSLTSVIHEAKVVTPPQGYLPQLLPKPIIKPSVVNGNALLTQSNSPGNVNSGSILPHTSDLKQQSTAPTTGHTKTIIQFVPFTPEDISPLNFLSPPVASATEIVTAADQPDTRSNYITGIPSPSKGDFIADSNVHITQKDPMKIIPAPKLDFSWNHFRPLPSETPQQPAGASDFALFSVHANNNKQHHDKQQAQKGQDPQQKTRIISDQQEQAAAETAEVVVWSKMATSGNNSGNDVLWPGSTDSAADIITGYVSSSTISSTIEHVQDEREVQTTTSTEPKTTMSPIHVKEIATTTEASRDEEIVRPAIPSIPELHGNFQPSFGKFSYSSKPQDRSYKPELESSVPLLSQLPAIRVTKNDENSSVFSASLSLPNLADDQHVAGSQIHETSVHVENIPRVRTIKLQQSAGAEGEGKSSTPFYKMGKMSPQGAMYTVTQGHSKVKFFGYNALHNGELKPIEGKYFTNLLKKHEQGDVDWKFSPYLPVRLPSGGGNPAFKIIPKKSIPISNGKKPTIRPVFFAKRPSTVDPSGSSSSNDNEHPSSNATWHPSIVVSEPFEYHAHLENMAEGQGRLSTSQSSPA